MTLDEAKGRVMVLLTEMRRELEGQGWRLRFSGAIDFAPIIVEELETVRADPAAVREAREAQAAIYTGNLCAGCGAATRRAGACEVCDNCGATSSCG